MDIKVKKNGLIKLPQEVMDELYIEEGDLLSIQIENDKIILSETTAYPKKFYRFLADKAMELKKNHDNDRNWRKKEIKSTALEKNLKQLL